MLQAVLLVVASVVGISASRLTSPSNSLAVRLSSVRLLKSSYASQSPNSFVCSSSCPLPCQMSNLNPEQTLLFSFTLLIISYSCLLLLFFLQLFNSISLQFSKAITLLLLLNIIVASHLLFLLFFCLLLKSHFSFSVSLCALPPHPSACCLLLVAFNFAFDFCIYGHCLPQCLSRVIDFGKLQIFFLCFYCFSHVLFAPAFCVIFFVLGMYYAPNFSI